MRGTTSSKERLRDTLLDRLTDGSERHAQRWHLRLPDDNEPASTVRPLLVVLGLVALLVVLRGVVECGAAIGAVAGAVDRAGGGQS